MFDPLVLAAMLQTLQAYDFIHEPKEEGLEMEMCTSIIWSKLEGEPQAMSWAYFKRRDPLTVINVILGICIESSTTDEVTLRMQFYFDPNGQNRALLFLDYEMESMEDWDQARDNELDPCIQRAMNMAEEISEADTYEDLSD